MGAGDGITRYRPSRPRRWLPIVAALVPLGFWLAAIARLDNRSLIPVVLGITAVLVAGAAWWSMSTGVTITPTALVLRTYRGTTVLPWADIITLEPRWNTEWAMTQVWAMTREGWYVLPILATTPPVRGSLDTRTVGDATWWTWCERRDPDHQTVGLDPWRPNVDRRGRVVLRAPIGNRLYMPMAFGTYALGTTASASFSDYGAERLGTSLTSLLTMVVLCLAGALAYHRWSCVIVRPDEVVVRSITAGVVRVPRHHIANLREATDTWAANLGGGRYTRLAFDVYAPDEHDPWPRFRRVVRLPAPATAPTWQGNDPEYYRKWAWLHDQLSRLPADTWEPAGLSTDARIAPPG